MNYTPIKKDDFDKSFKYQKQSFLCYSDKKLRELYPEKNYKIVGLARKVDKDTENKLDLGKKQMSVFDTEKDNAMYRNIGYIPVSEENEYIAVQESMAAFLAALAGMAAATSAICFIILNTKPAITPEGGPVPQFNPLPPVDTNIEDYVNKEPDDTEAEKKAAPKGGGRISISYDATADVKLSTGEVTMAYRNPDTSSHDAVVSLYVVSDGVEYLVADSGRIPAGKQLKTMQLAADKSLFGSEGKYNAEYRVTYYDPKTGEKALTEAQIDDVTLVVRNS